MKIECAVEQLKTIIVNAAACAGKNATLPVLQAVLIIAKGKILTIRATNLSIGVEYTIPAKVEVEGTVALPGVVFANILNSVRDGSVVSLEEKEQVVILKTKHNTLRINTLSYEDFPTIPTVEGEQIVIPVKKFLEGMRSVVYSASVSEIKPEIASVFLYPKEDDAELVFVATDSFRLAEKKIKIKNASECKPCIIPVKNCAEIMRIFDQVNDDITLTFSDNQLLITTPGITVSSRVINGTFPDYKQIIPKESTTEIIILKQDLANAVKMASIFSDKFNQITITCDPKEKKVTLATKNSSIGDHTTDIEAVIKGNAIEASFNCKYVFDCLQSIGEDSVTLSFTEAHKPCIIKPVGNTNFLYLIMPMNR